MREREVEVQRGGAQRDDAAEEGGAEGADAAGGEEVAVDLPEVPDGACGGDEGIDGGLGRGNAMEAPPASRKDGEKVLAPRGFTFRCLRGAKHWPLESSGRRIRWCGGACLCCS